MSSLSGDENQIEENEPVRRTRSGRALKAPLATPKKTPSKKAVRGRNTRRGAQEIDTVDETNTIILEETDDNSETGENGMQQIGEIMVEQFEEETPVLQSQLDEPQTTDNLQCGQRDQDIQGVPELEAPPPPVVSTNTPTVPILSTLKTKETVQVMEDTEDTVITLEDNSLEQILQTEDDNPVDETINGVKIESNQIMDFGDVMNTIVSADIPLLNEKPEDNKVKVVAEAMDVEDSVRQISDAADDSFEKIVADEMEVAEINKEIPDIVSEKGEGVAVVEGEVKKIEPDTEAVSEDEFPSEAPAKEPETEAVSDEELPVAPPADLGETESVSEDELPPDSDKKRKAAKTAAKTPERKVKADVRAKRKLNADGEYDPSSPTSETNDETPAKKLALAVDTEAGEKAEVKPASPKKKILPELDKYWKAVNEDPSDFTGWTYLLQYVDQENDAEAAREAYEKFLVRYPYCYGYWRKYADYEKKKGNPDNVQKVFDEGLNAISLSVDLWLHYIIHCKSVHEKDEGKMREQYERAIQACGLEFRSDRLWESYIKWEQDGKRLSRVTALYDRLLSTPTFGYMSHFQTFQEFVSANSPQRILTVDDFLAIRAEVKVLLKSDETPGSTPADDVPPGEEPAAHEVPPTDEETRVIREKIISTRRKMHKANVNAVSARWSYEEGIKRPYFHVKPLERCQLKNWKEYLDFEIEQKDQGRIIILFERCLIACALYDEFWLRFVRYLESLTSDNANKIRDVYSRACTVHHPKKPNLHLQWATFEEGQGNFDKAAEILENIDNVMPNMLQVAYRRINLERRRGELDKSCALYESYITNSKNRTIANNIAVKYARFLCKFRNDIDKAVKVLLKATDKDKDNPRLYLQLIDLGLQRNPVDTQEVVGYMDLFIEREHADLEQRVLFAQRKVEFLEDFSTDIKQVLKAHEHFQKCIKQAKERKKSKSEDSKIDLSPPKKGKTSDTSSVPPPPTASSQSSYQYSSSTSGPYQSQQQFQSGQYGSQSGYQQSYQQYPPPSDPNYANYQNWQYGQSGPQAYGSYNQWGSYNYY
ncbi:pre-mRNA-processing factor 39 isoform X1 [Diachasmimorpha longicaudata]|uniref:pre-mRNA-processing factor 39 isoform X1 n=2 Tax=Diachasmimorpha longicaudata TaxID=58733 RepID=UPI0030B90E83